MSEINYLPPKNRNQLNSILTFINSIKRGLYFVFDFGVSKDLFISRIEFFVIDFARILVIQFEDVLLRESLLLRFLLKKIFLEFKRRFL